MRSPTSTSPCFGCRAGSSPPPASTWPWGSASSALLLGIPPHARHQRGRVGVPRDAAVRLCLRRIRPTKVVQSRTLGRETKARGGRLMDLELTRYGIAGDRAAEPTVARWASRKLRRLPRSLPDRLIRFPASPGRGRPWAKVRLRERSRRLFPVWIERPRFDLPWMSFVVLCTALGLASVDFADVASRRGYGNVNASVLFWFGLLLIFVPIAGRVLMQGTHRRERLTLILLLGAALYGVKVLGSPVPSPTSTSTSTCGAPRTFSAPSTSSRPTHSSRPPPTIPGWARSPRASWISPGSVSSPRA